MKYDSHPTPAPTNFSMTDYHFKLFVVHKGSYAKRERNANPSKFFHYKDALAWILKQKSPRHSHWTEVIGG